MIYTYLKNSSKFQGSASSILCHNFLNLSVAVDHQVAV